MWRAYLVIIAVVLVMAPGLAMMIKEDWRDLVKWWQGL